MAVTSLNLPPELENITSVVAQGYTALTVDHRERSRSIGLDIRGMHEWYARVTLPGQKGG